MHELKTKQLMAIKKIPTRVSMDELIENTTEHIMQQSNNEFDRDLKELKDEFDRDLKEIDDTFNRDLKELDDTFNRDLKELKDEFEDRFDRDLKQIKDEFDRNLKEVHNDTTEDRLLVPWRKLYTRHLISMQVHHYDWVDELENWIQGTAWVQEYNGYDNYYEIYTLDHSKKELEIEEFDDNFYEWQIDELAKPGSP